MLVKNLTKQTLKLRAKNTRIVLLPLATVHIDDNLISKEQIKAIYGRYVMFPVDKPVGEEDAKADVPNKTEEDLAPQEGDANVPTGEEVADKANEEGEIVGDKDNAGDIDSENAGNDLDLDDSEIDKLVNDVLAEVEEECKEEAPVQKPKAKANGKKATGKKANK